MNESDSFSGNRPRSRLAPEILSVVERLTAARPRSVGDATAADVRAGRMANRPALTPQGEELWLPVAPAPLHARLYRAEAPSAVIVFFHGGGWTLGNSAVSDPALRRLLAKTNCTLLSMDYRLAPEHPFPAAADDAYAAVSWAAENMVALAGRPVPLIVAGESAGGNLAAVTARRARDAAHPRIDAQILLCPCVSGQLDTPFMRSFDPPFLTAEEVEWFFRQYVPDQEDRSNPDAFPLHATDFSGLAPAFVATAEWDILRDQGVQYGAKLQAAGVPVVGLTYTGSFHGFFELDEGAAPSQRLTDDLAAFIAGISQDFSSSRPTRAPARAD